MPSRPDRYAVIGNPIAHSRSPSIHARFAEACGQTLVYERLLAPVDGLREAVTRFRAEGGRGLNVTVPFKRGAYDLATRRTDRARIAGAANFLAFSEGEILADNTDGVGLVTDLESRLGLELRGAQVLVLGAGGAVRGVVALLLAAGVGRLVLANRTRARLDELMADLAAQGVSLDRIQTRDLASLGGGAAGAGVLDGPLDLVVNATSSALSGEAPAVSAGLLGSARLAYDMVYGSEPTPFMQAANAAGCPRVSDGLGMLIEQAAESFFLWRGQRPVTGPVYEALRAELQGTR